MNTSISKTRKVMTSISIHNSILININIDNIIRNNENKWYEWHFCVLGDLLSKDVNDFYMSIVYDSILITRLHILRIMSFTLLIIMVLIVVLKLSIYIIMFIIILTNGWNWMSMVNNYIMIIGNYV